MTPFYRIVWIYLPASYNFKRVVDRYGRFSLKNDNGRLSAPVNNFFEYLRKQQRLKFYANKLLNFNILKHKNFQLNKTRMVNPEENKINKTKA